MKNSICLLYRYLKVDYKKVFYSYRLYVSILGAVLTYFLAYFTNEVEGTTVISCFWNLLYGIVFLLSFTWCILPYGCGFSEEVEYKYIHLSVLRGSVRMYCTSKIIMIFISSILTMTIAIVLFGIVLNIQLPWALLDDGIIDVAIRSGAFRSVLQNEKYILYLLLCGLQYGILSGIISVLAAYLSLFVSNKLLVFSVPIMGYYILNYFIKLLFDWQAKYDLFMIFNPMCNIWNHDILSFLYAVAVGLLGFIVLNELIIHRVKRIIQYG